MVKTGNRVKCIAHEGEHTGTVVSEITTDKLGVAWDLAEQLREESIVRWMTSRARLAEDDGLFITDRAAIELMVDNEV